VADCSCCRGIWPLLERAHCEFLVEASEQWADGQAAVPLREAAVQAEQLYHSARQELTQRVVAAAWGTVDAESSEVAFEVAETAAQALADAVDMKLIPGWSPQQAALKAWVCDRLRDIFGNPFRRRRIDERWRTSTVVSLAQSIYSDRAFDHLPILADALEDAGCDNVDILNHCRGGSEHVRGCWVVDLVLGKE
jgi:hypothetical protein